MDNLNTLTAFLGWCTVINSGALCLASLALFVAREPIMQIHSRLLGIDENLLPGQYFSYLANYKILITIFNLSPYIALKLL